MREPTNDTRPWNWNSPRPWCAIIKPLASLRRWSRCEKSASRAALSRSPWVTRTHAFLVGTSDGIKSERLVSVDCSGRVAVERPSDRWLGCLCRACVEEFIGKAPLELRRNFADFLLELLCRASPRTEGIGRDSRRSIRLPRPLATATRLFYSTSCLASAQPKKRRAEGGYISSSPSHASDRAPPNVSSSTARASALSRKASTAPSSRACVS